jgi:hypothetical protein
MSTASDYGNERLDTVDRLAYDMSQASYLAPDKRPTHVQNYEYDQFLSNVDTAVYHNHATKKTHVSNRGSQSAYDWLVSDAQILTGTEGYGSRFTRAVKQTKDAHKKYGYDVETSGHSLGAQASSYTTEQLGGEDYYRGGVGFNPGQSSLGRAGYFSKQKRDCDKKKNRPAYCDKQTSIVEEGDFVSGRNVACNVITLGYGGKMCRKQGYGKTKYFQHHHKNNLGQVIQNFSNHSLGNFEYREAEK